MRDRGCWTMIMISVADTQLLTTKSNEVAKYYVKWASNLATGGPRWRKSSLTQDLYVPPRSQCKNTLTTSSFFFSVRNEVSAHPLGPVKAFRSAIVAAREGHIGASEGGSIHSSRSSCSPIPGTNKSSSCCCCCIALPVPAPVPTVPVPTAPVLAMYVMTFGVILKV
ncbi:unnamed protein product [Sphagnum tenellum]